jgi:CRISPR-associated exonuclease Cas4
MKINGTMINYYFHCHTQLWLYAKRVGFESSSDEVKLGKSLEKVNKHRVKEVHFRKFSVDKLTKDYIIEIKKSDSNILGAKWQLIFYLYKLEQIGVSKKGRLEFFENLHQNKRRFELVLNERTKQKLFKILKDIKQIISLPAPSKPVLENKCNGCAYYDYCFL